MLRRFFARARRASIHLGSAFRPDSPRFASIVLLACSTCGCGLFEGRSADLFPDSVQTNGVCPGSPECSDDRSEGSVADDDDVDGPPTTTPEPDALLSVPDVDPTEPGVDATQPDVDPDEPPLAMPTDPPPEMPGDVPMAEPAEPVPGQPPEPPAPPVPPGLDAGSGLDAGVPPPPGRPPRPPDAESV
jgi:hypothetical protein